MIPFIRSLSELMVLTQSRDKKIEFSKTNESHNSTVYSAQRKRYLSSKGKNEVDLPNLPKIVRLKWKKNKEALSKFIENLDYNNQIQSSYNLTLISRLSKNKEKDIA